MRLRWRTCDLWKAGIVVAGMLLLLVFITWVPLSVASAHEEASGVITPGMATMQLTPTEDATITALNKEKLAQEVQQLKDQNDPSFLDWLRASASIFISTLVVVIGGLIGLGRWLADRRSEREKRAEDRFQAAVTGLGDDKEGARVGAAVLLRTFLRPGYEQFYAQVFDLAVANLRRLRTAHPSTDSDIPLPPTTLSQTLSMVFKEAFPLARSQNEGTPQALDASRIQLDNSYLEKADLKQVWMPRAFLRSANLRQADLNGAILWETDLSGADLWGANLSGADLWKVMLIGARLYGVNFSEAKLVGADLTGANLCAVKNLEAARSLKNTILHRVEGLTGEQIAICKAKGAIVDEDPTDSLSESAAFTVPPLLPSQNNHVQASPAPSAQGSLRPPDIDTSSAASSQPNSGL